MTVALAPVFFTASKTVSNTREALVDLPALAGGDAADDGGAVFAHLLGVERPRRAGDP
jgi:hypothetical protein